MSTSRRTTRVTGLVPLAAEAAPEKASEVLAERHGAPGDRPALGHQLVIRRVVRMGEITWIVKNPEKDAYYNFTDAEWGIIELLDGSRTRGEIVDEYNRLFPRANIDLTFVLEYEEMLRNTDLLEQSVAERNLQLLRKFKTARQRAAEEKAEGFNPFFIQFKVVDPNRFLDRTVRFVRWIWTPPVVLLWSLAAAWTIGVFALHFGPIWSGTYELYAFLRKPLIDVLQFFFILCFIGGIHELGHAYATKIYGGEVHDIGIALLYFTPAFYCDTTDSILFQNKWHRLWTTTAGIYIEGFICSAATALWVASYPDSLLHELAYKTMLFTGVSTIFFNINPLIKIDGYYALTSLLDIPELREESFRYLGAQFQKRVLRLPVEVPAASRRKRRIYWIYGPLALAYTAVIMRFVGGLFYNFYSKYFPNVAVVLLLLTLYRIFRKRVRLVTRTARLFYLDKKEVVMAGRRTPRAVTAAAVLLLVFFVPWTRRTLSTEAVLRPARTVRIEAPEDAVVTEVLAAESQSVTAGSSLLRLNSRAVEAALVGATGERDRLARAEAGAVVAGEAGQAFEDLSLETAAVAELEDATTRQGLLEVRAPIQGIVLTPRLEDLKGRFVLAGSPLAEVGDCRRLTAELPVSERLVGDIRVGAPVKALLRQRPLSPALGQIVRIAPATAGQPATPTGLKDPRAPEDQPDQFVALAQFDNPDGTLRPGDVLRAKIYCPRASYAARLARVLWRWIRTIAW